MIDSHCHFDLPEFDGKHEQVLRDCERLGITRLLVPGLSLPRFPNLIKMHKQYKQIDIALGCHPYFLDYSDDSSRIKLLDELMNTAKQYCEDIVAIGECGLDRKQSLDMDFQQSILEGHLAVAQTTNKPLILHHRQSHNEIIRLLKTQQFNLGGVIHAFSGSQQIAHTYIDMGFVLGVGGTITYERAVKTRETIKHIPLEFLVLETDSPDMPLKGYQGQVNSPTQLHLVAKALSDLKQTDLAKLIHQTSVNYKRMFLT